VSQRIDFAGFKDSQITALYAAHDRDLWVGTAQGGLNRLDRRTGILTVYQDDPRDPASLGAEFTGAV
jgi:ligand-binding sensor domain-containing protein